MTNITLASHRQASLAATLLLPLAAYNARYPVPTNTAVLNTSPNSAGAYLASRQTTPILKFNNDPSIQPNGSFFSVDLPGAHLVSLSSYVSAPEDPSCCTAWRVLPVGPAWRLPPGGSCLCLAVGCWSRSAPSSGSS